MSVRERNKDAVEGCASEIEIERERERERDKDWQWVKEKYTERDIIKR